MTETIHTFIREMFDAGAHYGYRTSRRHPSVSNYIFGVKNGVEIFDLEKTKEAFERAALFVEETAARGKHVLFVGGKLEARRVIREAGEMLSVPFVAGRWVGGTLTNFPMIKSRVDRLETLISDKEKGELTKYTKKERLLIDREIKRLDEAFGGLRGMKEIPAALFVVDVKHEKTAVAEARALGIPVIGLSNSDCNIRAIEYPIPGNDVNIRSVTFFVTAIAEAYKKGAQRAPKKNTTELKRNSPRGEGETEFSRRASHRDHAGRPHTRVESRS